jgi:hypothetical protein
MNESLLFSRTQLLARLIHQQEEALAAQPGNIYQTRDSP